MIICLQNIAPCEEKHYRHYHVISKKLQNASVLEMLKLEFDDLLAVDGTECLHFSHAHLHHTIHQLRTHCPNQLQLNISIQDHVLNKA